MSTESPAPNSPPGTPSGDPSAGADIDLKRITVLVVEDEEAINDMICAVLQKIGVQRAVAVYNAEDAIYQLEDDEQTKIDIALVDLMLPGASGLSLIRTIREHKRERLKKLPVVVITSYTSMKVYKRAAEFDINGFMRKPVAPGSLETAIVKALGGKVSAKAMQSYRADAQALHKSSGDKKKPGFFAMLFGLEGAASQSTTANAARPGTSGGTLGGTSSGAPSTKPKPKINRRA